MKRYQEGELVTVLDYGTQKRAVVTTAQVSEIVFVLLDGRRRWFHETSINAAPEIGRQLDFSANLYGQEQLF